MEQQELQMQLELQKKELVAKYEDATKHYLMGVLEYIDARRAKALKNKKMSCSELQHIIKLAIISLKTDLDAIHKASAHWHDEYVKQAQRDAFLQKMSPLKSVNSKDTGCVMPKIGTEV